MHEGAATDTGTVVCLGGGGAVDKQAKLEATQKALDSLLAHGVVEDMMREDAVNFKFQTTRWENLLEHERRQVVDDGTMCGTRVHVAQAQK